LFLPLLLPDGFREVQEGGEKRLKEGHTGWGHLRNNVFSVDSILHSKYFIAIHYFRDVARPRHYGGRLTLQNLP
jgi:hypothetical protein